MKNIQLTIAIFCTFLWSGSDLLACHFFGAQNLQTEIIAGADVNGDGDQNDICFQPFSQSGASCWVYAELSVIEAGCNSTQSQAFSTAQIFAANSGTGFLPPVCIDDVPLCPGKQFDVVLNIRRLQNPGTVPLDANECDDRNDAAQGAGSQTTQCPVGGGAPCVGVPIDPNGWLGACDPGGGTSFNQNWAQDILTSNTQPGLLEYALDIDFLGAYMNNYGVFDGQCTTDILDWVVDDETDDQFTVTNDQVGPADPVLNPGIQQINNANIGANDDFLNSPAGSLFIAEGTSNRDVVMVPCGSSPQLNFDFQSCDVGTFSTFEMNIVQTDECGNVINTPVQNPTNQTPPLNTPTINHNFSGIDGAGTPYDVGAVTSLQGYGGDADGVDCATCDGGSTGYVDVDICINNSSCNSITAIDGDNTGHCYKFRFVPIPSVAGLLTLVGDEGNGCAEADPLCPEPDLDPVASNTNGGIGGESNGAGTINGYGVGIPAADAAVAVDGSDPANIVDDNIICWDDEFQLRITDWHLKNCSDGLFMDWSTTAGFNPVTGNEVTFAIPGANSEGDSGTPDEVLDPTGVISAGGTAADPADDSVIDIIAANSGVYPTCQTVYFKLFAEDNAAADGGTQCTTSCYDESNEVAVVFLPELQVPTLTAAACAFNELTFSVDGGAPACALAGGDYTVQILDEAGNLIPVTDSGDGCTMTAGAQMDTPTTYQTEVDCDDLPGDQVIMINTAGAPGTNTEVTVAYAAATGGMQITGLPEGCYQVRVSDNQSCGWKYSATACVQDPLIVEVIPSQNACTNDPCDLQDGAIPPTVDGTLNQTNPNEVDIVIYGGGLTFGDDVVDPANNNCQPVTCVYGGATVTATSSIDGALAPIAGPLTTQADFYQTFTGLTAGTHSITFTDDSNPGCPIVVEVNAYDPLAVTAGGTGSCGELDITNITGWWDPNNANFTDAPTGYNVEIELLDCNNACSGTIFGPINNMTAFGGIEFAAGVNGVPAGGLPEGTYQIRVDDGRTDGTCDTHSPSCMIFTATVTGCCPQATDAAGNLDICGTWDPATNTQNAGTAPDLSAGNVGIVIDGDFLAGLNTGDADADGIDWFMGPDPFADPAYDPTLLVPTDDCTEATYTIYAFLRCDHDICAGTFTPGAVESNPNVSNNDSYIAVGSVTVTVWPEVFFFEDQDQDGAVDPAFIPGIYPNDPLHCQLQLTPSCATFDVAYTVTDDVSGVDPAAPVNTTGSPILIDPDAIFGTGISGTVGFTLTNPNYPGTEVACVDINLTANYTCCIADAGDIDPIDNICIGDQVDAQESNFTPPPEYGYEFVLADATGTIVDGPNTDGIFVPTAPGDYCIVGSNYLQLNGGMMQNNTPGSLLADLSHNNNCFDTTMVCFSVGSYPVIDITGCNNPMDSISIDGTYPDGNLYDLPEVFVYCAEGDGCVDANVTAGTAPFTYEWNELDAACTFPGPAIGTGSNLSNLNTGTYEVTVTDAFGCVARDTVKIFVPEPPSLNINNAVDEVWICPDGEFTIGANAQTGSDFCRDFCGTTIAQCIVDATSIIEVCINFTHPWISDFGFDIEAPDGTIVPLVTEVCCPNSDADGNICFTNDPATGFAPLDWNAFPTGTADILGTGQGISGTWFPQGGAGAFGVFTGVDANSGPWILHVHDDIAGIEGTILDWSITITTPGGCNLVSQSNGVNTFIPDFTDVTFPSNAPTCLSIDNVNTFYHWTGQDGTDSGVQPLTAPGFVIPEITVNPPTNGTTEYYLEVFDLWGCSAMDTFRIHVPDDIVLDYTSGCNYGQIDVTAMGGYAGAQGIDFTFEITPDPNGVGIVNDPGAVNYGGLPCGEYTISVNDNTPLSALPLTVSAGPFTGNTGACTGTGCVPPGGPTCFNLNVTGFANVLGGSNGATLNGACFDLAASDVGQYNVTLTSPAGTTMTLYDLFEAFGTDLEPCFQDAVPGIGVGTPPFNGIFGPSSGTFAGFDGENPNGVWQLCITSSNFDDAWLEDFSLLITPAPCVEEIFVEVFDPVVLDAVKDCDGTTTINATGGYAGACFTPAAGAMPYIFTVSGPGVTNNTGVFTTADVPAGIYTIEVNDNNQNTDPIADCVQTIDVVICDPLSIDNVVTVNADCDDTNGSITITASGGTSSVGLGNIEYSIDGGATWQNSGSFTGLPPGNYQIIIRNDDLSCELIGSIEVIDAPESPTNIQVTPTDPTDCANSDGQITVTANGSGAIQYSMDGGATWQTSGTFTGLPAGNYTIMIEHTTAAGVCIEEVNVVLTAPLGPSLDVATPTDPTDCNNNDGTITISASGQFGSFQYSTDGGATWQPLPTPANSTVITGLPPGTYDIMISNGDGSCPTAITQVVINAVTPPAIDNVVIVNPDCGATNGSITITASGGSGSYVYSIDGGTTFTNTTGVFTGLPAGNYPIVISNADGSCVVNGNVRFSSNPRLQILIMW